MITKRIAARKDRGSSARSALRYGEGLKRDRVTGNMVSKSHRTRLANFGLVDDGIYIVQSAGELINSGPIDDGKYIVNNAEEMAEIIELAAAEMQATCDRNMRVTAEQTLKATQWRDEVKASIMNGDETYIRETVYDRLLGLLFPEMAEALRNPFGTPLMYLGENSDESQSETQPSQFWTSDDVILRGQEFDKWARRNPDAARAWLESPAGLRHQEQLAQEKKNLASQEYGRIKGKYM